MHVPRRLADVSLVQGPVHVLLLVGAAAGLAWLLLLRRDRRWWTRWVAGSAVVAGVVVAAAWTYVDVAKPWPDGLPTVALAWGGAAVLGLLLLAAGWRGRRWWIRIAAGLAAVALVLGAADAVNGTYQAFPTLGTALQLAPADSTGAAAVLRTVPDPGPPVAGSPLARTWRPPPGLPQHGAVLQVHIPATRSGFSARAAWLYVPPAYLTPHRPLLPVLVLLGGQPGSPRDWLDGGRIAQKMDAWADAHGGLAPVVVMPDALGGEVSNSLCTNSAIARADTYLAQDVPAWITSALQVDPNTAHWAVGGISFGGTCALQLAVAHPALFPTFFDASGQEAPDLGGRTRTIDVAFRGDAAAFAAVDPLQELAGARYPRTAAYLAAGARDRVYGPQVVVVARALRAAGAEVSDHVLPGGHSWAVWGPAFSQALPWLTTRMGLAP